MRPLLEKAKAKAVAANPDAAGPAMEEPEESAPAASSKPATAASKKKAGGPTRTNPASKTATVASKAATESSGRPSTAAKAAPKASPAKTTAGPRVGAGIKSMPKPFQEEVEEAFAINPGNKEARAAADNKSKWIHDEIKPAHLAAAKKHSEAIFGVEVSTMMWSSDFKKHQ